MASFLGVAAAMKSIQRVLDAAFVDEEPVTGQHTTTVLIRGGDFPADATLPTILTGHKLSLFVYRIEANRAMRAAWSGVGSLDGRAHLPLDVHFLVTAWSSMAEYEQQILGRAIQSLETTPVLSGPVLHPDGGWAPLEAVQVQLEDLGTEAMMRIFDSLPGNYRLSMPYLARVVRVDGRIAQSPREVATVVTGLTPSAAP